MGVQARKWNARARPMAPNSASRHAIIARKAAISSLGDMLRLGASGALSIGTGRACRMCLTGPGCLSASTRFLPRGAGADQTALGATGLGAARPATSAGPATTANGAVRETTRNTRTGLSAGGEVMAADDASTCNTSSGERPLRNTTRAGSSAAGLGAENASCAANQAVEGARSAPFARSRGFDMGR